MIFIIGYHSVLPRREITEDLKKVSMPLDLFEKQIRYLIEHGHTQIQFRDLENIKNRKIKRPTIIYFDDGFKDNIKYVLPILKKYNLTATFFVVPKYAEGSQKYMNWREIRQLSVEEMEIGSHTFSHALLDVLSSEEAIKELVASKEKIESEIGSEVIAFSYPKGRYNAQTSKIVEQSGYKYAVTTKYGLNDISDIKNKPFIFKKIGPRVYESLTDFKVRLYSYNLFK